MAPLSLAGVEAKLRRAEEHIYALKNDIRWWMNANPYTYVSGCTPDFRKYFITIRRKTDCEIPIHKWGLILGDAIHNLRSALDHLVYSIAIFQTGLNPPPFDTLLAFPLYDSGAQFIRFRNRFKPSPLCDDVWTAMENVQPYIRKHPVVPPLLGILADFDNADKHKFLKIAFATPEEIDIGFTGPEIQSGTQVVASCFYGEIEDGTEIHSFTFDRPTPNMEYDRVNMDMTFAVWHGKRNASDKPWKERSEVSALLRDLTTEVKDVIAIVAAST